MTHRSLVLAVGADGFAVAVRATIRPFHALTIGFTASATVRKAASISLLSGYQCALSALSCTHSGAWERQGPSPSPSPASQA